MISHAQRPPLCAPARRSLQEFCESVRHDRQRTTDFLFIMERVDAKMDKLRLNL